MEGSERAWDTLGDDDDGGEGAYGLGGLASPRRPQQGAYGQGGLASPGLDDSPDAGGAGSGRERFPSVASSFDDDGPPALAGPSHPYHGGQYTTTAADSTASFTSTSLPSPPRKPYAQLAPDASTSTIRLVPARPAPDGNPFNDDGGGGDDDDGQSTFSRAAADDDDEGDAEQEERRRTDAERTVGSGGGGGRPPHDRGDSRGSRFVEGE